MAEKLLDRKEFISKDSEDRELKLYVRRPNIKDIENGEFRFKMAKSKAIRGGAMTIEEATNVIKERGLWTDEQEKELVSLFKEIDAKLEKLVTIQDMEEGKKIVNAITALRVKVQMIQGPRIDILTNTAEAYAGEIRTQYYISQCTFNQETNEKVYKSFEDVLTKGNEPYTVAAAEKMIYLLNNIDDFKDRLGEHKWAKEHNVTI